MKILIPTLLFLICFQFTEAQLKKKDMPIDSTSGIITYSAVVYADSATKDEL
jgi:hypothetical protein